MLRGCTRSKKIYRSAHKQKSAAAPPTPLVKSDLLYEVERVVDARVGKWGLEYFVKWRGYDTSDNSWIDELPPFFQKNSAFYQKKLRSGYASDEDVRPSTSSSQSSDDEYSDENESSSDDEEVEVDSDDEVEIDSDDEEDLAAADDDVVEVHDDVIIGRVVVPSKEPKQASDDAHEVALQSRKRKRAMLEESDDEGSSVRGKEAVGVVKASVALQVHTKKEHLAMQAFLALSDVVSKFVNDTESDSD